MKRISQTAKEFSWALPETFQQLVVVSTIRFLDDGVKGDDLGRDALAWSVKSFGEVRDVLL